MPIESTCELPTSFVAGDSLTFLIQNPARSPEDGWGLKFVLQAPTPIPVVATVTGDGDFQVDITPTASAAVPPGVYPSALVYTNVGLTERVTVRNRAFCLVLPNPLSPLAASWAKETLEAVQEAIQKIASSVNSQVIVNGQQFTKQNLPALMSLRDRLIVEVGAESGAAGYPTRGGSKTIRTRFVS